MKKTAVLLLTLLLVPSFAFAQQVPLTPEQRAALEAELKDVETQIAAQEAILQSQKQQSASISRDIAILNAKIEKAKLDIKVKNILIQGLGKDINDKQVIIGNLEDKIGRENESLAQLLRKANEIETYSMPEMLLSGQDFSQFFGELDTFDSVEKALKTSFADLKSIQDETAAQKDALQNRKDSETDAKAAIEANKRDIEKNQAQLNVLLGLSKQQEKSYQAMLDERAKRADEIRNALFALRDIPAIPFAKALEYATAASAKTGVRPAFLLAILTQESSLGKNVGACLVTDLTTGSGVGITSGNPVTKVMKPDRDVPAFQQITSELGLDPRQTRVSCPLAVGWGGAMGPAQFIPSTWQLLKDRLVSALGISTPNPWVPQHAFMASAIFLSDLGAGSQSYSAERNAACKYYSGASCGQKSGGSAYGNQVMAKAAYIQENMIDLIQNNS